MYKYKAEKLQNKKCLSCKFCEYYYDYSNYMCSIKGCYNNSKYKSFTLESFIKEIKDSNI